MSKRDLVKSLDWKGVHETLKDVPAHFFQSEGFNPFNHWNDDKKELEEWYKLTDTAAERIVDAYHKGFNTATASFSNILQSFTESQHSVKKIQENMLESRRILSGKSQNLKDVWFENEKTKCILEILAKIEALEHVATHLDTFLRCKQHVHAVRLMQYTLDLLSGPDLREIEGLMDMRQELLTRRNTIQGYLIDELHSYIYLKNAEKPKPLTTGIRSRQGGHRGSVTAQDGADGARDGLNAAIYSSPSEASVSSASLASPLSAGPNRKKDANAKLVNGQKGGGALAKGAQAKGAKAIGATLSDEDDDDDDDPAAPMNLARLASKSGPQSPSSKPRKTSVPFGGPTAKAGPNGANANSNAVPGGNNSNNNSRSVGSLEEQQQSHALAALATMHALVHADVNAGAAPPKGSTSQAPGSASKSSRQGVVISSPGGSMSGLADDEKDEAHWLMMEETKAEYLKDPEANGKKYMSLLVQALDEMNQMSSLRTQVQKRLKPELRALIDKEKAVMRARFKALQPVKNRLLGGPAVNSAGSAGAGSSTNGPSHGVLRKMGSDGDIKEERTAVEPVGGRSMRGSITGALVEDDPFQPSVLLVEFVERICGLFTRVLKNHIDLSALVNHRLIKKGLADDKQGQLAIIGAGGVWDVLQLQLQIMLSEYFQIEDGTGTRATRRTGPQDSNSLFLSFLFEDSRDASIARMSSGLLKQPRPKAEDEVERVEEGWVRPTVYNVTAAYRPVVQFVEYGSTMIHVLLNNVLSKEAPQLGMFLSGFLESAFLPRIASDMNLRMDQILADPAAFTARDLSGGAMVAAAAAAASSGGANGGGSAVTSDTYGLSTFHHSPILHCAVQVSSLLVRVVSVMCMLPGSVNELMKIVENLLLRIIEKCHEKYLEVTQSCYVAQRLLDSKIMKGLKGDALYRHYRQECPYPEPNALAEFFAEDHIVFRALYRKDFLLPRAQLMFEPGQWSVLALLSETLDWLAEQVYQMTDPSFAAAIESNYRERRARLTLANKKSSKSRSSSSSSTSSSTPAPGGRERTGSVVSEGPPGRNPAGGNDQRRNTEVNPEDGTALTRRGASNRSQVLASLGSSGIGGVSVLSLGKPFSLTSAAGSQAAGSIGSLLPNVQQVEKQDRRSYLNRVLNPRLLATDAGSPPHSTVPSPYIPPESRSRLSIIVSDATSLLPSSSHLPSLAPHPPGALPSPLPLPFNLSSMLSLSPNNNAGPASLFNRPPPPLPPLPGSPPQATSGIGSPAPALVTLGSDGFSAAVDDKRYRLADVCQQLSDRCMLTLRMEMHAHFFFFLKNIQSGSYWIASDVTEPEPFIADLNTDLTMIDEVLTKHFSQAKLRYMFGGASVLMSNIIIHSLPNLHDKRVNKKGVSKMCRNILALQQNLTSIISGQEAQFDRARQYYELLHLTDDELTQFKVENATVFNSSQIAALFEVETPYRKPR